MPTRIAGPGREPAVNLPGLLTLAIVVLAAIHGVREWLLAERTDIRLLLDLAFMPGPWSVALGWRGIDDLVAAATAGIDDPAMAAARAAFATFLAEDGPRPWTPLSYVLLHGSWLHLGLNCVWLAAFGAPVVRRLGATRSLVLAAATALGGVAAHWLTHPASTQPVIGASAVVSGFMAAAATFVFNRPLGEGLFDHPETRRRASVPAMLANRSALLFLGSWMVVNVVFGLLAGPLGVVEGGVAWEAHIGGLLVGLLLFPALDPTGPSPDRRPGEGGPMDTGWDAARDG